MRNTDDSKFTPVTTVLDNLGDIKLSNEQQKVFDLLENTSKNYFITGKAGTGKSVLLSYFVAHTMKNVAVLAPTGVAALNVAGQTLHSFYMMSPAFQNVLIDKERHRLRSDTKRAIKRLDAIVIDEISMVRSDVITMVDAKMRYARRSHRPFGGCQGILFGDPYQLEPIEIKDDDELSVFRSQYRGNFFFETKTYEHAEVECHELSSVYRQDDAEDIAILNRLRSGERSDELVELINSRCCGKTLPDDTECIMLAARNSEVNYANTTGLAALSGDEHVYVGRLEGSMKESDCNTPLVLRLKVGAQVMMTKNDAADSDEGSKGGRWVNGTLATVTGLTDYSITVRIGEHEHVVRPVTWDKCGFVEDYDAEAQGMVLKRVTVGKFEQFPVKLAYAITVHKSQGQTYDRVRIDLGASGAFAKGQTYVALSRCRSLAELYLERPLRPSDISVSPKVVDFMAGM